MDQTVSEVRKRYNQAREKHLNDAAAESADVMRNIETRWNNEFYAKIRDFAVESGRYSADEFANVTDWRVVEGIIAVMDKVQVQRVVDNGGDGKPEISEPAQRKIRRQRQRQRRNSQGQFQSSKNAVLESTNAKGDGSLREHFATKLAAENR
jgi:hypothetical protein